MVKVCFGHHAFASTTAYCHAQHVFSCVFPSVRWGHISPTSEVLLRGPLGSGYMHNTSSLRTSSGGSLCLDCLLWGGFAPPKFAPSPCEYLAVVKDHQLILSLGFDRSGGRWLSVCFGPGAFCLLSHKAQGVREDIGGGTSVSSVSCSCPLVSGFKHG